MTTYRNNSQEMTLEVLTIITSQIIAKNLLFWCLTWKYLLNDITCSHSIYIKSRSQPHTYIYTHTDTQYQLIIKYNFRCMLLGITIHSYAYTLCICISGRCMSMHLCLISVRTVAIYFCI